MTGRMEISAGFMVWISDVDIMKYGSNELELRV